MSPAVGADIESLCRKCGDVWHVVVAKDGDQIAKVQCKQCNGYHKYRPPPSAKKGASRSVSKRSTSKSSSKKKTQTVSARFDEPQVEANTNKPVVPYKFSETYEAGDRIDHPKFGHGVVEITSEPGKIQVFFPDGRRWLAVAKPKSDSLERPRPFQHDEPKGPPKW